MIRMSQNMLEKICAVVKFVLEWSKQNLLFGTFFKWLARIGIYCEYNFVTIVLILPR
jgi:hypothetical protein